MARELDRFEKQQGGCLGCTAASEWGRRKGDEVETGGQQGHVDHWERLGFSAKGSREPLKVFQLRGGGCDFTCVTIHPAARWIME